MSLHRACTQQSISNSHKNYVKWPSIVTDQVTTYFNLFCFIQTKLSDKNVIKTSINNNKKHKQYKTYIPSGSCFNVVNIQKL